MNQIISGFYKLSREQKIEKVAEACHLSFHDKSVLDTYLHPTKQQLFNDISENCISNYLLPYSVAPNFLINNKLFFVPMVIEESSVVAAASKAASFWVKHGGFHYQVVNDEKVGQLFFEFSGSITDASAFVQTHSHRLKNSIKLIEERMVQRGGGLMGFEVKAHEPCNGGLFELHCRFKTANSMGANFINSCLEAMKEVLNDALVENDKGGVVMAILSNYTPNCMVKCWVEAPMEALYSYSAQLKGQEFVRRFEQAVHLAKTDVFRATTHNKGIFNGIDAVVLATGNDFRATASAGHAYASKSGRYASLTSLVVKDGLFRYTLEVPLALGTVGGLTTLHPLAKLSMEVLNNPSANELMGIAASVGLANNFSAVASLISTGIQSGHMKLHLQNILNGLAVSEEERASAQLFFADKTVSYAAVTDFIFQLREDAKQ